MGRLTPTDPIYRIAFLVEKVGDTRILEVRGVEVTTHMLVANPIVVELLRTHAKVLAKHDAGELQDVTPAQEPLICKPN